MASKCQENVDNTNNAELYKQYVIILDKKIRNLEKRKAKLDDYKQKQQSGMELNEDQKQAISHYAEVLALLETLNDLHKTYISINSDISRNFKKQTKKVKTEKENDQNFMISFILKLYYLLSTIKIPNIKTEILKNKEMKISLEDLDILDKLYQAIFDIDKHSYSDYITIATENLISIYNKKQKIFDGTLYTFDKIKDLLDAIDRLDIIKANVTSAKSDIETIDRKSKSISEESSLSEETDAVIVEKPPQDILDQNFNFNGLPSIIKDASQLRKLEQLINLQKESANKHQFNFGDKTTPLTPKSLNDLLASFQSSFNFVQDSLIESGQQQAYF